MHQPQIGSLDEIVSHYIRHHRDKAHAEMRFYEMQRNVPAVLRKAALCVLPSGKRHPHQRRIPRAVLERAEAALQAAVNSLSIASDFAALHAAVDREIGGISGIGALTVYDVAHRLGAYFGQEPSLVYLHAGTKDGAAAFGLKGSSIHPKRLPAEFSRLTAAEIEDCLCIYKDDLRGSRRNRLDGCRKSAMRGEGSRSCQ